MSHRDKDFSIICLLVVLLFPGCLGKDYPLTQTSSEAIQEHNWLKRCKNYLVSQHAELVNSRLVISREGNWVTRFDVTALCEILKSNIDSANDDITNTVRLDLIILLLAEMEPITEDTIITIYRSVHHDYDNMFPFAQIALQMLHRRGKGVIPLVCNKVFYPQDNIDYYCKDLGWRVLVDLREDSVEEVSKYLQDNESKKRLLAAEILSAIGTQAKSASFTLYRCIQDKDELVRIESALALWKIEEWSGAFEIFRQTLESTDRHVLIRTLWTLRTLGPAARNFTPLLNELLVKYKGEVIKDDLLERPLSEHIKETLEEIEGKNGVK